MSNTKQILAMLKSKAAGDDEQFYSIALQVAAAEARRGHRSTAEELRSAVDQARSTKSRGAAVPIQFSQPRGELEALIDLREPKLKLKDVVLHDGVREKLEDLIRRSCSNHWMQSRTAKRH